MKQRVVAGWAVAADAHMNVRFSNSSSSPSRKHSCASGVHSTLSSYLLGIVVPRIGLMGKGLEQTFLQKRQTKPKAYETALNAGH